jgi:aminoglycoside 3-N-acetyltransferase
MRLTFFKNLEMPKKMTNQKDYIEHLAENWKSCGVKKGDMLFLHSNIIRTLYEARRLGIKISAEDILDSFLLALGSKGTLLLPLFNFDFPTSKYFDLRHTPSQMGALTEIARLRAGSIRTGHPIYSFVALGHSKEQFSSVDNKSGYGADSPFGLLHRLDAKIASLDLDDQSCMTFYHYVEESHNVSYRYFKNFTGTYVDENGIETEKTYTLFVRDLKRNVTTYVNPTGELLWKKGFYKGFRPNEGPGLRTIKANDMYNFTDKLIMQRKAEGNLFIFGDKNGRKRNI